MRCIHHSAHVLRLFLTCASVCPTPPRHASSFWKVFVGDLVNKGPMSAEVVRWARERNVLSVRGNHDDAALSVLRRSGKWTTKEPPPSYDYVTQLSPEDVKYLEGLPYTLALPDLQVLVVHAGLVPMRPLKEQLPDDMFKMRNVAPLSAEPGASLAACERVIDGSEPWAQRYEGEHGHVVFGHDAKRGLQQEQFATGLDTGCCYGGALTALILPERKLMSTPARRMYEQPGRRPDAK